MPYIYRSTITETLTCYYYQIDEAYFCTINLKIDTDSGSPHIPHRKYIYR